MPSYVVRKNITQQTADKLIGKIIRITFLNQSNNKKDIFNNYGYFTNIGPIYNIIPFKIQKSNVILIFYFDNENNSNQLKWSIYTYEHIEIPKNPQNFIYNIVVNDNNVINGSVPTS